MLVTERFGQSLWTTLKSVQEKTLYKLAGLGSVSFDEGYAFAVNAYANLSRFHKPRET